MQVAEIPQHIPPSMLATWLKRTAICLVVVIAILVLVYAVKALFSSSPPHKKGITTIKLLPEQPPPPPPPPKEPPKEQPKDAPKELKEVPQPKPDPTPPAEQLKMEGTAGDGPSPFATGAVNNEYQGGDTSTKIGGGPNPNQFAWYTSQIKSVLEAALAKNDQLKQKSYTGIILVWIGKSGALDRVELVTSTGTPALDEAIRQSLKETSNLKEAPPTDMPQPVKLKVTSRSSS